MAKAFQKIYTEITAITKATCSLKAEGVGNDELATVNGKLAQVVKIMGNDVTLQVFQGTEGIPTNAEVVFLGKAPSLRVSDQLAGRFFNAYGEPIDGGPDVEGEEVEIGGPSVNPVRRKQPSELIATGIAGIDLNNTLVSGQKIPFFADPDQPYNQVMANVALRAEADKIILGGMGLTNDDYLYFKNVFSNAGVLDRIVSFVNTTENPPVERLLIPDMALTAAEYFAVQKHEKVWTRFRRRTLCRVRSIPTWQKSTRKPCSSLRKPVAVLSQSLPLQPFRAATSHTLFLITRVISPRVSCTSAVIPTSEKWLSIRSVRCRV